MAFIEIQKRCDECEKTRAAVAQLRSEVERSLLDYQNLYEKVRTNLGKLAKRARLDSEEPADNGQNDPLAPYRAALVARKLGSQKG